MFGIQQDQQQYYILLQVDNAVLALEEDLSRVVRREGGVVALVNY